MPHLPQIPDAVATLICWATLLIVAWVLTIKVLVLVLDLLFAPISVYGQR
jgi:hypothetical protein